ncbi:hypothetical protein [Streptomyces sp. NPDC059761]|uniref:hypothetical protein n=1 Tax=Streptomyces sp. NPDC059761 TaxID=3346937 RepID=UPI003660241C
MKGDGHQQHPLIGRLVRDIASGTEGRLMAVLIEEVPTYTGAVRTSRLAYLRPAAGGVEFPTHLENIEPLGPA